jgi:hypothetical protein
LSSEQKHQPAAIEGVRERERKTESERERERDTVWVFYTGFIIVIVGPASQTGRRSLAGKTLRVVQQDNGRNDQDKKIGCRALLAHLAT